MTKIPNISCRVNDFWITYTKEKTISQFYSDISILDISGNEITRKTNFVNSPIIYKNIYFYQTDWNLIGLRIKYPTNEIIQYPLFSNLNNKTKIWLTRIYSSTNLNNDLILLIDNLEGYCSLYNNQSQFLGNLEYLLERNYFIKRALVLLLLISSYRNHQTNGHLRSFPYFCMSLVFLNILLFKFWSEFQKLEKTKEK